MVPPLPTRPPAISAVRRLGQAVVSLLVLGPPGDRHQRHAAPRRRSTLPDTTTPLPLNGTLSSLATHPSGTHFCSVEMENDRGVQSQTQLDTRSNALESITLGTGFCEYLRFSAVGAQGNIAAWPRGSGGYRVGISPLPAEKEGNYLINLDLFSFEASHSASTKNSADPVNQFYTDQFSGSPTATLIAGFQHLRRSVFKFQQSHESHGVFNGAELVVGNSNTFTYQCQIPGLKTIVIRSSSRHSRLSRLQSCSHLPPLLTLPTSTPWPFRSPVPSLLNQNVSLPCPTISYHNLAFISLNGSKVETRFTLMGLGSYVKHDLFNPSQR